MVGVDERFVQRPVRPGLRPVLTYAAERFDLPPGHVAEYKIKFIQRGVAFERIEKWE